MGHTKDFADVIRMEMAGDPDLAEQIERELFNADLASKVYSARKKAGLTQAQLAERVDTHQSVISRIEDADYDGRSLGLLTRIARALDLHLRVDFHERPHCQVARLSQSFSVELPEGSPILQGPLLSFHGYVISNPEEEHVSPPETYRTTNTIVVGGLTMSTGRAMITAGR